MCFRIALKVILCYCIYSNNYLIIKYIAKYCIWIIQDYTIYFLKRWVPRAVGRQRKPGNGRHSWLQSHRHSKHWHYTGLLFDVRKKRFFSVHSTAIRRVIGNSIEYPWNLWNDFYRITQLVEKGFVVKWLKDNAFYLASQRGNNTCMYQEGVSPKGTAIDLTEAQGAFWILVAGIMFTVII